MSPSDAVLSSVLLLSRPGPSRDRDGLPDSLGALQTPPVADGVKDPLCRDGWPLHTGPGSLPALGTEVWWLPLCTVQMAPSRTPFLDTAQPL